MAEAPDRLFINGENDFQLGMWSRERIARTDVEYVRGTPPTADDEQRAREIVKTWVASLEIGVAKPPGSITRLTNSVAASLAQSRADAEQCEVDAQNCPKKIWLHELIEDGLVEREWSKQPSPAPYHRSVRYYRGDIAGGMIEDARADLAAKVEAKRGAYQRDLDRDEYASDAAVARNTCEEILALLKGEK